MNIFMNLVKRSLIKKGTEGRIGASKGVSALIRASLLLTLNSWTRPWLANSSYFLVGLIRRLTQGLHQAQDSGAIAMEI